MSEIAVEDDKKFSRWWLISWSIERQTIRTNEYGVNGDQIAGQLCSKIINRS